MSSIDTSGYGMSGMRPDQYTSKVAGKNSPIEEETSKTGSLSEFGDSVEISPETLEKSRASRIAKIEEQREEFTASIRSKLESLVKSKRDLDGHIGSVLKNAGIKLSDGEKLRVETGSNGKISVAGIDDKEKRQKIEDALNNEVGLGQKIQAYNTTFRKTSSELKSDTGLSLNELILEQKGTRKGDGVPLEEGEEGSGIGLNKGLDQFALFAENGDLGGMVSELGATSSISYSTDSKTAADPEGALKKLLQNALGEVKEAFGKKNDEFYATMKEAGVEIDEETRKNFVFDLSGVDIRVDSHGKIEIEGQVAGYADKDKEGKAIIENILKQMMTKRDETDEFVLFDEANKRLLEDYEIAFGDDAAKDAKISMSVGEGKPTGEVTLSAPSKEKELDAAIGEKANALITNMVDFEVETPFEVQVGEDGKLSVANLPENELERKQVEQALEVLNANLENEEDETYGELAKAVRHRGTFMKGGLDDIYANKDDEEKGAPTVTGYTVAGDPRDGITTALPQ